MGLGFNEQYASFVLPHWRWGVASLTFQRFGVGGIEGRDDRNRLTNDDLSDAETELTLGYGRAVGALWSFGGSLKLRKQNLAGYSDSGFGLDLGLMVHPLRAFDSTRAHAEDLTLGLAVRNAVEPALRLNQEPVKDPTGIRFGGAYRWHFGREGEVLAAMDVEKTRDMNTHLHAGVEVSVVQPLALRAGLNQGRFVAGAGVYWREMGVDYQFEDHPTEFFHRFGVSLKFGKTRQEAQRLAVAAEEEQLQRRLNAAFDDQRRRRLTELLAKAESAVRSEDVTEASNILAMVQVIDPNTTGLAELEAQILLLRAAEQEQDGDYAAAMVSLHRVKELDPTNGRAGIMLQRIREASDLQARRTDKIRGQLDRAQDAFAAGNLVQARDGFQSVLKLAPTDKEAQSMLAFTEVAIATRIENHLAQARTLIDADQLDRAKAELAAVRALEAQAPGLAATEKSLADRKIRSLAAVQEIAPQVENQEPTARPEPVAPKLTVQQQREMEDLYQRGVAAMEAGQKDQALHFWELVWSSDPDYQNVTEYLAQNYLARGMEFFVAGDLPEAVTNWESAVRVDPTDPKALGYLQRAREQSDRMRKMDN
jgi:tetratricopeptide (TPR) repeat protein